MEDCICQKSCGFDSVREMAAEFPRFDLMVVSFRGLFKSEGERTIRHASGRSSVDEVELVHDDG